MPRARAALCCIFALIGLAVAPACLLPLAAVALPVTVGASIAQPAPTSAPMALNRTVALPAIVGLVLVVAVALAVIYVVTQAYTDSFWGRAEAPHTAGVATLMVASEPASALEAAHTTTAEPDAPEAADSLTSAAVPRQSHRPRGNTTKDSTGARATALALLRTTTHALTGLLRRQPSTAPAPAKRHVAVPKARQVAAAAQFVPDEPLAPSADPQYPGTTPTPAEGFFASSVDPRATTSSH